MQTRTLLFALAGCIGLSLAARGLPACPTCPQNLGPSLSEQVTTADATVVVEWQAGEAADVERGFAGSTTYRIVEVLRDTTGEFDVDAVITLRRYRAAESGEKFLMLGLADAPFDWHPPIGVNDAVVDYIRGLPPADAASAERLSYAMKHLEHAERTISNDVMAEFAVAPYRDVAALADRVDREKVRGWLSDPETDMTRIGFYSLLLGLAGEAEDAAFLEAKLLEPSQDFRLGVDGMVAGYLLLTGERGLDVIDREKLENKEAAFSETYAAMQGLRFMWNYEPGRIEKARLRASMRILLDRPELADLVVTDLARWQDWTIVDRLIELYHAEEFNLPTLKRAIVRYYFVAERDGRKTEGAATPAHAVKAARYLAQLRKDDPETVKQAERYFFLK